MHFQRMTSDLRRPAVEEGRLPQPAETWKREGGRLRECDLAAPPPSLPHFIYLLFPPSLSLLPCPCFLSSCTSFSLHFSSLLSSVIISPSFSLPFVPLPSHPLLLLSPLHSPSSPLPVHFPQTSTTKR